MEKILELNVLSMGDYLALQATPELIRDLSTIFIEYDMMPNTITAQEITPEGLKTSYRPQFIKLDNTEQILFLPDRIEMRFFQHDNSIDVNAAIIKASEIFEKISSIITEKGNRMAIHVRGVFENIINKNMFLNPDYYQKDFSEWSTRTVSIDNITINENEEKVNIVINQEFNANGFQSVLNSSPKIFHGVMYLLDFNTAPSSGRNLFVLSQMRDFLREIETYITEARTMLGAVNVDKN